MEDRKFMYIILIALIGSMAITWGIQGATLASLPSATGTNSGQTYYITISGSTTCYPIIEQAANDFMVNYSNYNIRVSSGGSSTGIKNAELGISDIGMASRDVKAPPDENSTGKLIDWVFASDGIAIIFDKNNNHGMTNLTLQQLFLIYNGTYTTWNQLGSSYTGDIDVVTRAAGSGTRASFEELVTYNGEQLGDNPGYIANVGSYTTEAENPGVASYVASHPDSIGYVGLGFVNDQQLIAAKISTNGTDYYSPSIASVKAGEYPISRNLHLITNGKPAPYILTFLDYIYGPRGQEIVAKEGFVSLY
ncbi:MAG: phosphate ABC transporter substrate-binding protein [Candidatus Lokiarchaeota archaeon]